MSRRDVPPAPAVLKAPRTGGLAVAAGGLGVAGLLLPWYHPRLGVPLDGITYPGATYHAWSGLRLLVLAPILLVIWAFFWIEAMRGKHHARGRSGPDPVRALGVQSIVVGGLSLLGAVLSVFVMKPHYPDWDALARQVRARGSSLEQNPQIGLYLVVIGAVLLIATGVSVLVRAGPAAGPPVADRAGAADHGSGPVPG